MNGYGEKTETYQTYILDNNMTKFISFSNLECFSKYLLKLSVNFVPCECGSDHDVHNV